MRTTAPRHRCCRRSQVWVTHPLVDGLQRWQAPESAAPSLKPCKRYVYGLHARESLFSNLKPARPASQRGSRRAERGRKETEEQGEGKSGCEKYACRNIRRNIPYVVLPGKTACNGCHKLHVKCSLQPQSTTRLPQVKGPRVVEAIAELGQEDAVMMPGEISYLEEMQLGLVNTQRHLQELKQHETECECKKQWKRMAQAVWTARNQSQEDTRLTHSETSTGRTGRSLLHVARPSSCSARSRSRTGFALLSSDGPVVPPVDESSLIQMMIKQEHEDANAATLGTITERGLERAAQKAKRRERITREDAERVERAERDWAKKEQKKAVIEAELQALMAKKAKLEEAPVEPKMEPLPHGRTMFGAG
ncbi:hypothetical protein DFH08DRAFT_803484 [Mycena albidolilacea]|uniref:Uncharacterized protein n=1 Tax=Mycena albidolilacea TaxID=1033008 RepID=A0AAD7ACY9_9AGAR|nr:hypothetical protein DFH08DRAFT_803484 [Mycena albidolilacea]